jgi:hypothetical protein
MGDLVYRSPFDKEKGTISMVETTRHLLPDPEGAVSSLKEDYRIAGSHYRQIIR